MSRIKGGILHSKHRRGVLKLTKGFRWGRKSKVKLAKTATKKAGQYAFVDRRLKKRINRGLQQVRINAAVRKFGLSFSKFIGELKKKDMAFDRKVLAEIAMKQPKLFSAIVEAVK